MTKRATVLVVVASLAMSAGQTLAVTYKTLDASSAGTDIYQGTIAVGVSGNNVVGNYKDAADHNHGFLYNGVNYTTLDDPLAGPFGTFPRAISGNRIVGYYADASDAYHGFLFDGTSWTTLDDPFATRGTLPNGISGNTIIGRYVTYPDTNHGFVYDGTNWTTVDHPLADSSGTTFSGIDGSRVVGSYRDEFDANWHSFEYDGTTLTSLPDAPGTNYYSVATGISGQNIVGYFNDATANHGFLYDGANWTILDEPPENYFPTKDGSTTIALGVDGNTIVGIYESSTKIYGLGPLYHGFIATVPEPTSLDLLLLAIALLLVFHPDRRRKLSIDWPLSAFS
jgi:hypothetical protein